MAACDYSPPLGPDGRLMSRYGVRPGRVSRLPTFHAGIDLGVPGKRAGVVPVFSVAAGIVERLPHDEELRSPFSGYGNACVLRHIGRDAGWWTFYAHLYRHASYLPTFRDRGFVLPAGVVLGYIGATTNGKFAGMMHHLHFEVRHAKSGGGTPLPGPYQTNNVDPQAWLADRGVTFEGGAIKVSGEACPAVPAFSLARVHAALGQVVQP